MITEQQKFSFWVVDQNPTSVELQIQTPPLILTLTLIIFHTNWVSQIVRNFYFLLSNSSHSPLLSSLFSPSHLILSWVTRWCGRIFFQNTCFILFLGLSNSALQREKTVCQISKICAKSFCSCLAISSLHIWTTTSKTNEPIPCGSPHPCYPVSLYSVPCESIIITL